VLYALIGGGSVGALAKSGTKCSARPAAWAGSRAAGGSPGSRARQPVPLPRPPRGECASSTWCSTTRNAPDLPALDGFDLHVRPGETVALVGPSGAGKSTVLSLLLRFHDPQSGSVSIDGIDLRRLDPANCARRSRWCRSSRRSSPPAPPTTSATAGSRPDDAQLEAAARSAEAHEFIAALPDGYASELGERGARLSGGQQQRIAIARALLKDAPILLLDEATSALDAQSERAVQHALENLMAGRTTLVIAHRLATVLKADRIVVMDRGRIVAEGTHAQLHGRGRAVRRTGETAVPGLRRRQPFRPLTVTGPTD
jgi:ATP-binding cassette, subfamily B, bacterial